jgi:hypothetical protein
MWPGLARRARAERGDQRKCMADSDPRKVGLVLGAGGVPATALSPLPACNQGSQATRIGSG